MDGNGFYLWSTILAEVIFNSYKTNSRRGRINGETVFFDDYGQMYVERECMNEQVINILENIATGSKLSLMIHPNSDAILDMRVNDIVALEFNDSREKLTDDKNGFLLLGIFCYSSAIYGVIVFIQKKKIKKGKWI